MKKIFFALVLFVSSLTFSQVSAVKHGFSTNFYGLTSSGSNIYVGGSLDLFRSSDDGATWDSTLIVESTFGQIPGINNVEGIMMDSTGTGFMVGFTNLGNPYSVFKTVNNGNTWDIVFQESGNLPSYLKDIIKASNGDLYTCGTYGKMFKSSDGGSNWESINIYGSDECNEMVFFQ